MMQAVNNTVPTNLGAPQSSSTDESEQVADNSDFVNHGAYTAFCFLDSADDFAAQSSSNKYSISCSFHNPGLQRWETARSNWLQHANNTSQSGSDDGTPQAVAVPLDVDEIIDVIFSPRWRGGQPTANSNNAGDDLRNPPRRFPNNVPLPQMVDVLVDLWEAEGLDT